MKSPARSKAFAVNRSCLLPQRTEARRGEHAGNPELSATRNQAFHDGQVRAAASYILLELFATLTMMPAFNLKITDLVPAMHSIQVRAEASGPWTMFRDHGHSDYERDWTFRF